MKHSYKYFSLLFCDLNWNLTNKEKFELLSNDYSREGVKSYSSNNFDFEHFRQPIILVVTACILYNKLLIIDFILVFKTLFWSNYLQNWSRQNKLKCKKHQLTGQYSHLSSSPYSKYQQNQSSNFEADFISVILQSQLTQ